MQICLKNPFGQPRGFTGCTIQRSPTCSIDTSPSLGLSCLGIRKAMELPERKMRVLMYIPCIH